MSAGVQSKRLCEDSGNMEFRTLQQKAETWCHCNGYILLLSEEEERRMVFRNKEKDDITFFIVCPELTNKSWHIWSDNEDILCFLARIQDVISSCKERSLADVLDMIHKDLSELVDGGGFAAQAQAPAPASDTDDDLEEEEEDDDEDFDDDVGYYQEEDLDALEDVEPETQDFLFTGEGSSSAVHRLLADMKTFKKSEGMFGVEGGPRGDNLFVWDIKLIDFPKDSLLGKDLQAYARNTKHEPVVYMEMQFPKDYPMAPPFVRVLRPKFRFLTGHVTIGGSICMEMLTRSGWRPTNDIESVLVQIRAEIMSDEKTRLENCEHDTEYNETAARQAFNRTVNRYGWNK